MESRDASDREEEQIVHVREALMSPSDGGTPTLRTARFLNYTITAIDDDVFELPLEAFASRPEISPVRFSFSGWGSPSVNWIEWVNAMSESHAPIWRKSGVHDAIMVSRYHIKRQDDLMMALVEKWCTETNSFVFPWGEATVTLEDMIVLGGFSTIGNNVLGSIKSKEMKSVEEKLKIAKREISATSGKKCGVSLWMKEMMNSGREIEHEAFMFTWLSCFVFPDSADLVRDNLFAAAVQLARGIRLALAPPVLAGIYRDLGVLKEKLGGSIPFKNTEEAMEVVVASPFQFVQVWAWERITAVRLSQPNPLQPGDPRMAQWHHLGGQESHPKPVNLREVLDSAGESFEYRPYTKPLKDFRFPKFYMCSDCNVSVESDEEIVAFGRCLRFSKLVGLDCVEPYYPHRVAMQFGYDMDIPSVVPARVETPEVAWKHYIRPISDGMLFIPSRLREADFTFGYIRWWKQSVAAKRSSQKLPLSPVRENPAATMVTTTTTTGMVKRASEITCPASTRIPVKSMMGRSESSSRVVASLTGSEQAGKQLNETNKSLGRSLSDIPDLKGALRGPREAKGHGHVTFLLPGSPETLPKGQSLSPNPMPSAKDPPDRTTRPLAQVAERTKQSSFPHRDPRRALSAPYKEVKNNTASTRPRATREPNDSSSLSDIPLGGSSSSGSNSALKQSKPAEEAASEGNELESSEANAVKSGEEMVTLKVQVGEEGEVTYQMPKSQYEDFRQVVQDVLKEVQTIKSALNK